MLRFLDPSQRRLFPAGRTASLMVLLASVAVLPQAQAQDAGQDQGVTTIRRYGGKVQRNGGQVIGISLAGTKVNDADLALLKQFKGLQTLDLSRTAVTDAGLKHIESLTGLRVLYLLDTRVSDAGLPHLKGLRNLKALLLNGTKVTKDGVRDIQLALPAVRIGH